MFATPKHISWNLANVKKCKQETQISVDIQTFDSCFKNLLLPPSRLTSAQIQI